MKKALLLLLPIVAIWIFWNSIFVTPLKILVVFFHESSHALMTILTGGAVDKMNIDSRQGGFVISRGGSRFLILSAGYLGSLVWGGLIYYLAASTRRDSTVLYILAIVILTITVLYMRNLFGIVFCVSTVAFMIFSAKKLPSDFNDIFLRIIGLTSMLYAPLDIYSDTMARSHLRSDAYMLGEEFFGTAFMWGLIWIIISVGLISVFLIWSIKKEKAISNEPSVDML